MKKEILVRTFDKPTDIYICGNYFEGVNPTLSITDDESQLLLKTSLNKREITTEGFVFIFTSEEFKKVKHNMITSYGDILFSQDFQGSIYLVVESSDPQLGFKDDFDIDDYFMYQLDDPNETDDANFFVRLDSEFGMGLWYGGFPSKAIGNFIEYDEDPEDSIQ